MDNSVWVSRYEYETALRLLASSAAMITEQGEQIKTLVKMLEQARNKALVHPHQEEQRFIVRAIGTGEMPRC